MPVPIPASHCDLLMRPVPGILSTLMPDGQPQSSLVWVDSDGQYLLINTTLERQKGRNMQANPRVTVLVVDPENISRWIEIRGLVVDFIQKDSDLHADLLTARYSSGRKQRFYGDVYPVEQKFKETRVIARIEPIKVTVDAIFK